MVSRFIYLFLVLPFYLLSAEFNAAVSRNEVGLGESFTLNLTLKEASAKTPPSIEPLKKAFTFHSQQQASNTIFNNGKLSSSITWKYVITAQSEGEILIPALTVETSEGTLSTQPIAISVVKSSSSNVKNLNENGITLTAEVSHDNPYKNEPLFITLKLTSKQSLANVQAQKFEVENAIVEAAGEPVTYDKIENGIRLGILELKYLITPLQPGRMLIPSIVIQGTIPQRRAMTGGSFFDDGFDPFSLFQGFEQLKPFAASTDEIVLNVLPPHAEVNPWLPAKSLKIQEIWNDSQKLQEGEVFTRSFIIEAEGIHSSQLPSLEGQQSQGNTLKVYADKPELKDEIKNGTLKSYRKELYTFIPEKSGNLFLPEITIAWWDAANQKKMVSTVPARTINVLPETKVAVNIHKPSLIEDFEQKPESPSLAFIQNPLLYFVIAGLAVLLLGAILWLVLLQRKMTRMLEKPQNKKEKTQPPENKVLVNKRKTFQSKREKLDDLNPT